ncbi:MAG: STAS domain-containing protein [Spirochaetes bacterium]|nr:STAS domain-containing protein [Spirochaetota bacterium]
MAYVIERRNDIIYIAIEDRVSISESEMLEREIKDKISENEKYFIINLSKATYLSSGFIRLLYSTYKYLNERKGVLILSSLSEDINRLFSIMELNSVFIIKNSDEECLNYLNEILNK